MSSPIGESSIFLSPTVVGVIEFYSLRSSKKSFKFIQILQNLFIIYLFDLFRFVEFLLEEHSFFLGVRLSSE